MDFETHLQARLARVEARGLLRSPPLVESVGAHALIDGRRLVSFASNDYLGLASDVTLQAALATAAATRGGAGSSRAVAGTHEAHCVAEQCLAELVRLPAARLFTSAYAANLGALGGLFGDGDVILSDSLNHASIIDGCRLSRARTLVYRHGDLEHLASLLEAHRAVSGVVAVVTETVFSMDGDIADVPALRRLTRARRAALVATAACVP